MVELSRIVDAARRAHGAALMGVVNLTPDSFYDGGRYEADAAAERRIDALLAEGADIIDIGGESTRPKALPVSADEQIARIAHALEYAVGKGALVSVDTMSPAVADYALAKGARIVNDVSCLADEGLADVAARRGAALIVTHCRGRMTDMTGFSQWPDGGYVDIVDDVLWDWEAARTRAVARGMSARDIVLDPGLGFAKNARQSLEILRRLSEFQRADAIIAVGPGRKSFVAALDPSPPADRLGGTIAACLVAAQHGAHILRVHDVGAVRQALMLFLAVATPATEVARA